MAWLWLALLGSLTVLACSNAVAEDWDHDANIGLAVEAFLAVHRAGGLEAAASAVGNCYRSVDAIDAGDLQLQRFEYCASLDFAGYLTDRRAREGSAAAPIPYFSVEQIRDRLQRLGDWVRDPIAQQQILKAWAATTAAALDAQAR